ncbi:unnamed protein product [Linum trigynum]|uniref:Ycf2 n=1 Tax=Linum trigynum TaxID=586398 RepID=A0AAV2E070_9ROSI
MINEEKSLNLELSMIWNTEEEFWAQTSRNCWLQEGDQNTGFFHANTIKRRNRNKILKLKNSEGIWLEEKLDMDTHVNALYRDLFTSKEGLFDYSLLDGFPQLGANKATKPDGFQGFFFRKFWNLIGDQLCE